MRSAILVFLAVPLLTLAQDNEARELVAKAIQARGGEDKLAKLKVVREKTKGNVYQDQDKEAIPFTGDSMVQFPAHFRLVFKVRIKDQEYSQTRVVNGAAAWFIDLKGELRDLEGKELDEFRQDLFHDDLLRLVPLLRYEGLKLAVLGESKVAGRAALVLRVSAQGKRDLELYFDKETHLLLKMSRQGYDADAKKLVSQEQFYSEYQTVAGIRYPMRLVSFQEGQKTMELEVTEVQFPSSLPASVFEKK